MEKWACFDQEELNFNKNGRKKGGQTTMIRILKNFKKNKISADKQKGAGKPKGP